MALMIVVVFKDKNRDQRSPRRRLMYVTINRMSEIH